MPDLVETVTGTNDFGGDVVEVNASTPESRGDVIVEENSDVGSLADGNTGSISGSSGDSDGTPQKVGGEASREEDAQGSDGAEPEAQGSDGSGEGETDLEQGSEGSVEEQASSSEEEAEGSQKVNKVPVARLNKEIDKRKQLENRVAELEAAARASHSQPEAKADEPAAAEVSLDDFRDMQEAMLDGDTEKAFELFQKMNAPKQTGETFDADKIREEIRAEIHAEAMQKDLVATANDLGERYPELSSEGDLSDQGLIEEVVDLRDNFTRRGMTPADALKKAVKYVALENDLVDRKAKKPEPKKDMAKPSNIEAKLKLAEKERGKLSGESTPKEKSQKLDIGNMSEKDFSSLSSEAKARARGDFL